MEKVRCADFFCVWSLRLRTVPPHRVRLIRAPRPPSIHDNEQIVHDPSHDPARARQAVDLRQVAAIKETGPRDAGGDAQGK